MQMMKKEIERRLRANFALDGKCGTDPPHKFADSV